MTMNHISSNTPETEEIEYAVAYGTAVAMIGRRRRMIANNRSEVLETRGGTITSGHDIAAATDGQLGGQHSSEPDENTVNPIRPPARQSLRQSAATGARNGRHNRPRTGSDMNRGRKAA